MFINHIEQYYKLDFDGMKVMCEVKSIDADTVTLMSIVPFKKCLEHEIDGKIEYTIATCIGVMLDRATNEVVCYLHQEN